MISDERDECQLRAQIDVIERINRLVPLSDSVRGRKLRCLRGRRRRTGR